jgi:hypothetical protein
VRAVAGVVILVLAAWGLWVRSTDDEPRGPSAVPTSQNRSTDSRPTSPGAFSTILRPIRIGPPPWVRYATPLEGRWVADGGSGRVTLVVKNASFDVWQGVGQRQGMPTTHREMIVRDDRVTIHVRGSDEELATYRWRISGDRLTFEPVDPTVEAAALLAGLSFRSAG